MFIMAYLMANVADRQYGPATRWGLITQIVFTFAAVFSILVSYNDPLSWVIPVNGIAVCLSFFTGFRVMLIASKLPKPRHNPFKNSP